ncbi:hypothetical protein mRhiFer1_010156 [Rhinolophus ferrumequinum]|uniref:Uncharacterized protein n=1 Tax=Rhinolophus ferrumequinum TaxID=59479 RepID=A0A7J7XPT3_RHIFE|nr:hypothetical protein mRhiFer1_010156 [Rhinolophus ferrumequinum]
MAATPSALGWNQLWSRRETWFDTPPQALGSWKATSLFPVPLFEGLAAFLLDALLLSNQQTRLLFKGGDFFMGHSCQESRHRARGAEKGGQTRLLRASGEMTALPQASKQGGQKRRNPVLGPDHLAERSSRPHCKGGIVFDDRQRGRMKQTWAFEPDRLTLNPRSALCWLGELGPL